MSALSGHKGVCANDMSRWDMDLNGRIKSKQTQIDLIGNQDKKWSCQEGKIAAIYICRLVESTNMSSWRFPAIYVQNDAPPARPLATASS